MFKLNSIGSIATSNFTFRRPNLNLNLNFLLRKNKWAIKCAYRKETNSLQAAEEKNKGTEAYKKRKFDEALNHFEKAMVGLVDMSIVENLSSFQELDPENISYILNRSAVYFETEKFDDCIKDCQKAIDVGRAQRVDYKMIAR